ncbi:MAG TPA: biotin/lipoyl-containing protein [Anaerolineales bacterium]|nr:biotin/lipoyl-containing protein [Anaerolineales bacterium]
MKYITTINEKEFAVDIMDDHHVSVNDKVFEVDFESVSGQPVYSMLIDGQSYEAYVYAGEDEWQVLLLGQQYPVRVEDEREKRLKSSIGGKVQESGEFQLKAPMPGLVVAIPVSEGQQIEKGQVLILLESMKMQNELKSPRAGKVERLKVKAGESVEQRQVLLSIL